MVRAINMLKKSHRLSTKEFLEVMEKGKIYHSRLFLARVLILPAQSVKIAAVTPNKVASTAALRNKVRRLVYAAIQSFFTSIVPGARAIVFSKQETIRAGLKDLVADLKILFSKAKISV